MANAVRAGARDRRVTLQRFVVTGADSFNAPVGAWQDLAARWASKEDTSDGERARGGESRAAVITTRFVILWDSVTRTLTAKDRLLFGDRVYDIVSVKEIGRREGIEISCSARSEVELP